MKVAPGVAASMCFVLAVLLVIWGVWLLVTDDPDGGRHAMGAVMFVVAALGGLAGVVSLRQR